MNDQISSFVESIRKVKTTEEKARIVVTELLNSLSIPVEVITCCAIARWFDQEVLNAILEVSRVDKAKYVNLYEKIIGLAIIERYGATSYSINKYFREAILTDLWENHNKLYRNISRYLGSFYEKKLQQRENSPSSKEKHRKDAEYRQEWAYHLLVVNEAKGCEELHQLFSFLEMTGQYTQINRLLSIILEHETAGRLSEYARNWILYWRALSLGKKDSLVKKTELLQDLTRRLEPRGNVNALQALTQHTLSNAYSELGDQDNSWKYFILARSLISRLQNLQDQAAFLLPYYKHLGLSLNIQNPNPFDYLSLGFNLPNEPFGDFVGRETETTQLMQWLENPEQARFTVLYGMGGIGKTALAYNVAKEALAKGIIEDVCWASAKQATFVGKKIDFMIDRTDFNDLTISMIRTLGTDELDVDNPPSKKENLAFLTEYLLKHRVLIVIDNIETLEDVEALSEHLPKMIGRSYAIITSRIKPEIHGAVTIKLHGLSENASKELWFPQEQHIKVWTPARFRTTYELTGGHPLAMLYLKSEIKDNTYESALDQFRERKGDFYEFVYGEIWNSLSDDAREMLRYLSRFKEPVSRFRIERRFRTSTPHIDQVLFELEKVSLVNSVERDQPGDTSYQTDPLTTQFLRNR